MIAPVPVIPSFFVSAPLLPVCSPLRSREQILGGVVSTYQSAADAIQGRSTKQSRIPGLDFLRAIAISWVLLYHASLFDFASQRFWIVRYGWMGVDLFFVLSGYLIAKQLFVPMREGRQPLYRQFFVRRALRTMPAYLAVVFLYFALPQLRETPQIQPLWQFLTFTENLLIDAWDPKSFSHVWSLCVEEQFYLLLPLALFLIQRRPRLGTVICAFVAVFLFGVFVRGLLWAVYLRPVQFDPNANPDFSTLYLEKIYYPTWSRLDGLLVGVGLAGLEVWRPTIWAHLVKRPNALTIVGLAALILSSFLFDGQMATLYPAMIGYPLIAISMGCLLAASTNPSALIGAIQSPVIRSMATGSYSLYLIHKIAYQVVRANIAFTPLNDYKLIAALAIGIAFGAALYWAVERPFLRLRSHLTGPRRSPLPSVPASD